MVVVKGAKTDQFTPTVPRLKSDAFSDELRNVRPRADKLLEIVGQGAGRHAHLLVN